MCKVLLSIIIPTYNSRNYIEKCILSLLEYKKSDMEVIIIDDGGTDNTESFVKSLKDCRLKYYRQEHQGVSAARNLGVQCANGSYVVFVDADDFYAEKAIFVLMERLRISNLQEKMLLFGLKVHKYYSKDSYEEVDWYESLEGIKNASDAITEFLIALYGRNTFNSACRAVYDLNLIRKYHMKFPTDMKNGEDGIFNIQYCIRCKGIEILPETIYIYRLNINSKSSAQNTMTIDILNNVAKEINYKQKYLLEMENGSQKKQRFLETELWCNACMELYHYCKNLRKNYDKEEIKTIIFNDKELLSCVKGMLFNTRNIKDIFYYIGLLKILYMG